MQIKTPTHTQLGSINCEVKHPEFGWIAFTASENDGDSFAKQVWMALQDLDVAPFQPSESWKDTFISEIKSRVESAVLDLVGSPGPIEMGSWPNKIQAAQRILADQSCDEISLAPIKIKFDVDSKGAARIVLLRARLYELAKAVAETMEAEALGKLSETEPENVLNILEALKAKINDRKDDFSKIRASALNGDLSLIDAAEQQLMPPPQKYDGLTQD